MTDPTKPTTASPDGATAPDAAGTSVHLIAERADGSAAVVEPPARVSALQAHGAGAPALGDPGDPEAQLLIEPVRSPAAGGRLRLLFVALNGTEVMWNDQLAPRAMLLHPGDHLRVADGPLMEVALYHVPRLGPAPEDTTATCVFCRTPVAGRRCYVCPHCDGFSHCEDDDSEASLKCSTIAPFCHGCNKPISLTAGYLGEPEILNEPVS
ncbi:MAG: hypothetical protein HKN82_02115 [Akkermansiaceae bacterium]|nr:hypothetical protein [Akkermansiaceae bacterium]